MGAFFLCRNDYKYNSAMDLFQEMGFSSPETFTLGEYTLLVYPKITVPYPNVIIDRGYLLAVVGTLIYKGQDYAGSLRELYNDLINERMEFEQLIGQYTIIYGSSKEVHIITDPLGSKHVFTDREHQVLSSHMLPICQTIPGKLHLNKFAVYEKFLTGFIMSPETIFKEIHQINSDIAEQINNEDRGITVDCQKRVLSSEISTPSSLKICLTEQADQLQKYFKALYSSCKDGVDIGLSGGYDSRLVLACIHNYLQTPKHLHSHSTENEHKKDLEIAEKMADYVQVPCHVVKTKKLQHSDNVEEVLRNSVLYFDGRSSFSIGGCGEVYTSKYRANSTEGTSFTMTGVGGELFRNVFDIAQKNIRFSHFMNEKVFSLSFRNAVSESLYKKVSKEIITKASDRLRINSDEKVPKRIAHRYYCEIMMPDGQGVALDAYNQISCCIAPFLEPVIIAKGYEAIPFHGIGGEFEGQLIEFIDSGLASLPSSYGYPINYRPFKARLKERLRTLVPTELWEELSRRIKREKEINISPEQVYVGNETLRFAFNYMLQLLPEINISNLLKSAEDVKRIQFMAMTLFMFKERIESK